MINHTTSNLQTCLALVYIQGDCSSPPSPSFPPLYTSLWYGKSTSSSKCILEETHSAKVLSVSSRHVSLTEAVPTSLVLLNWLWPTQYQYVSIQALVTPLKTNGWNPKITPKKQKETHLSFHPPPLGGFKMLGFFGVYPPGKLTYPPICGTFEWISRLKPVWWDMSTGDSWGWFLYMLVL